jgi:hypothetical protein
MKKVFLILAAICAAALLAGCGKWKKQPHAYALGDTGPGKGKIFYYDAAGFAMTDNGQICHYLEAAPDDMPRGLAWASSQEYKETDISGTETAIGAGRKNTALILATDAEAPAAKACKDYKSNGKTDWFIPSKDELDKLYEHRDSVSTLWPNWYWSSSQHDNPGYNAWGQDFDNGVQENDSKGDANSVRAVRGF